MAATIPVNRWVRIRLPDGEVFGYTYVDSQAGTSAKGAAVSIPPRPQELDAVREGAGVTVRLSQGQWDVEGLSEEELARYELPCPPTWVPLFEPEARPWRVDPALKTAAHPTFPDDFEVLFMFPAERALERMWVRTTGVDEAIGGYCGELLNTSNCPGPLRAGAEVRFRAVSDQRSPFYVTPEMRANLDRWECQCTRCGFDMHFVPFEEIIAAQFKPPPGADGAHYEMEAFTTRCPVCRQTMMVGRRGKGVLAQMLSSLNAKASSSGRGESEGDGEPDGEDRAPPQRGKLVRWLRGLFKSRW